MPGHYDSQTGIISKIGGYPNTWNNISNFNKAPDSVKEANGWYLINYVNTTFNPDDEYRSEPVITWNAGTSKIDVTYTVTTKTTQEYDDDLQIEKDRIKKLISAYRDSKIVGGFTSNTKVYDSDLVSIQKISIATAAALSEGAAFTIDWTLQDDTTVTLDYADTKQLAMDLASHGDTMHQEARTWKTEVDAETTHAGLRTWFDGWEGNV